MSAIMQTQRPLARVAAAAASQPRNTPRVPSSVLPTYNQSPFMARISSRLPRTTQFLTARTAQRTETETLNSVELENVDRNYCDDFVCTSSPAVETTVRAFARDIERTRYTVSLLNSDVEFSDGLRSFKGADRYKRPSWIALNVQGASVRVTKMAMLDKGSAELKWNLKGSMYNVPLDVDVTTIITMNLLTGRIASHRESWDFSRTSPLAVAAVVATKLLWGATQLAKDGGDGLNKAMDSLSSFDEDTSSIYNNPSDPTKFFQQQDTRLPDAIALATVFSFLYFIFKSFEAIETLNK